MDFCFPRNNEEEFIEIASRLNIKDLVFTYTSEKDIKKIENFKTALLVKPRHVHKARKLVDYVIVESGEDDRFALEKASPDFMFGFEFLNRKDHMHQRASGINQVLCKFANKNNVKIVFPLSNFLELPSEKKSLVLGRFMQNVKLCKKYKVDLFISSFAKTPFGLRKNNDLKSFLRIF